MLKSNKSNEDIINLLEIFDIQMSKIGTEIILNRREFIKKLSDESQTIHRQLTSGGEELLDLDYISNVDFYGKNKYEIENDLLKKIEIKY